MTDLSTKTSGELVALYNEAAEKLGQKTVKKFSDKKTAIRRTTAILEELPAEKQRAKRQPRFIFSPREEIKDHREGTMRAKVVELLSSEDGASFEEVYQATWAQKVAAGKMTEDKGRLTTYEAVRLVHYALGYGLRQDEAGRIYLYK